MFYFAHYPVDHITEDLIHEISAGYVGVIDQIPPIFSAVKINGRSAYKSAHKGLHVVTRSRQTTIHQLQITKVNMPYVHLVVRCSTGTYIRTLAHDIGKALQSGAYLSSLKRVAIGPYELSQALAIQDLADKIKGYQAPVTDPVTTI